VDSPQAFYVAGGINCDPANNYNDPNAVSRINEYFGAGIKETCAYLRARLADKCGSATIHPGDQCLSSCRITNNFFMGYATWECKQKYTCNPRWNTAIDTNY
jgi:hypothetical protein